MRVLAFIKMRVTRESCCLTRVSELRPVSSSPRLLGAELLYFFCKIELQHRISQAGQPREMNTAFGTISGRRFLLGTPDW